MIDSVYLSSYQTNTMGLSNSCFQPKLHGQKIVNIVMYNFKCVKRQPNVIIYFYELQIKPVTRHDLTMSTTQSCENKWIIVRNLTYFNVVNREFTEHISE